MTHEELEQIAALVDGRLQGPERDAVLARIEADEALYEVYAAALADLEAEPAATAQQPPRAPRAESAGEVTPMPARAARPTRSWRAFGAVAALVTLAVALGLWLDAGTAVDSNAAVAVAAGASGRLPAEWDLHDWSVTRGPAAAAEPRTSLRLGVLTSDLYAAVEAADEDALVRIRTQLRSALQDVPLAQPALLALDGSGDAGALDPVTVEAALAAVAEEAPYRLGRWAGAARLATLAGLDADLRELDALPLTPILRQRVGASAISHLQSADALRDDPAAMRVELEAAIRAF